MIKQIFAAALLIGVVALLAFSVDTSEGKIVVRHDNVEKKPLEIELGKYLCFESKALITDLNNTAQAVMPNGDTYFFYDIANSFTWLMRQKNKDDVSRYILAKNAWYSRVDITPMGYGFGAYEFHTYSVNDNYFEDVLLYAARGETLINPLIFILLSENKI